MVSKKIFRMGAQKTPIQKPYEINVGQDSITLILWDRKDSLTGWIFHWSLTKATNTP